MKNLTLIIQLLTCCLLLMAIAVNKNQKILGREVNATTSGLQEEEVHDEWTTPDGYRVISTERLAHDIWGFGGNIPLHIYLKEGKIDRIEIQANSESPEFLSLATRSGLLSAWEGLTPEEALSKQVDAVSGATLSSSAIIESVQVAMQYATQGAPKKQTNGPWNDFRFWCVLVVVASGMFVPFVCKNIYFRWAQLALNVVVLGFWSGSFLSLSLLVNYLSNGINFWKAIIPLLLIIAAFIFPFFGKKGHYCAWMCPMGSCQELLGRIVPYKVKISPKNIQTLTEFREMLWILIMAIMWLGTGFELLDYELFAAFLFEQASVPLLVVAMLFAAMSMVVQRPYCRFVCPTGTLIKFAQQSK